jgi:chitosanase
MANRPDDVRAVQERLGVQQTGAFGPTTEEAVKRFQGRLGIQQTGAVGEQTWTALFREGLSALEKQTAQAIVNIFETGSARGDYANITLLGGDPGHLTYGRSQTTLASGNLYVLIKDYCEASGARRGQALRPYLSFLAAKDLALDNDLTLKNLLREAGSDPVMQRVQDDFFDRMYWNPAVTAAQNVGVALPLSVATVYDSTVHGSWPAMRDRTLKRFGTVMVIGEQEWISKYIATRRDWLGTHSIPILRQTVYRMDALQQLVDQRKWTLELPLTVRGVVINKEVLSS